MGNSQSKTENADSNSKGNELANLDLGREDHGGDIESLRRSKKVRTSGDHRSIAIDVEDVSELLKRFPLEFSVAEEKIVKKKIKTDNFVSQIIGNRIGDDDPDYLRWLDEYKKAKAALNRHPYDELLATPGDLMSTSLRVTTSLGALYGIWRTARLYTQMDKTYAKLHGVSLSSIGVFEISQGILFGTVVGLAVCLGVLAGDALSGAFESWQMGDVRGAQRQWHSICFAGAAVGLVGATSIAVAQRRTITYRGVLLTYLLSTAICTGAGLAVGHYSYKPHIASRPASGDVAQAQVPWYLQHNLDLNIEALFQRLRSR